MRTPPQNKALHKYCQEAADWCNEHGISPKVLLEIQEIRVTPEFVKDILREMGNMKYQKTSTKEWTTVELNEVFKDHWQAMKFHTNGEYDLDFPSIERTEEYLNSYEQMN